MGSLYIQETAGKMAIEVDKTLMTNYYNEKGVDALEVVLGGVAEQLIATNALTIDKGILMSAVHSAYTNALNLSSKSIVSVNSTLSVTCVLNEKTATYDFDIITYSATIKK